MGKLALTIPTTEPTFTVERFENGYYRIGGITLQSIQINLNQMMQTASAAPTLTAPRPAVTRTSHNKPAPAHKPRTITAAGRKAIAAAQRKRWAAKRAAEAIAGETAPVPVAQKRHRAKRQPKTMTAGA